MCQKTMGVPSLQRQISYAVLEIKESLKPIPHSEFLCSQLSCKVMRQEQSLGQELQCTDKT